MDENEWNRLLHEWTIKAGELTSKSATPKSIVITFKTMDNAMDFLGGQVVPTAPTAPTKSEQKCNSVRFRDLCTLFERIEKSQGTEHKLKLLFSKEMKKQMNGESLFPLLRLVLPTIDSERGKYGLKQAMVAKTYVQALHLDKTSDAASRLINWKDPSKAQGVEASRMIVGDFGTILEDVLKSRVRSEFSEATLKDVNELLDALASAVSQADKTNLIRERILNHFTAMEQKWLARIIFNDLKIGLKHETVLNHFYPTALKRFNECVNLRLVCEEEGITTELSGIQLGVCYSPMLAKGFPQSSVGQVTTVEMAMDEQPFIMDIKLDGERLAIHIDNTLTSGSTSTNTSNSNNNSGGNSASGSVNTIGSKYTTPVLMYTRRRNDYSEHYAPLGEIVRESVEIRTGPNMKVILDGEVCAWDKNNSCYLPFGNNANVRNKEREVWLAAKNGNNSGGNNSGGTQPPSQRSATSSTSNNNNNNTNNTNTTTNTNWDSNLTLWTMFIAFDILYLDGPNSQSIIQAALHDCNIYGRYVPSGEITNLPLIVRRNILARVIHPIPNRVCIVPNRIVTSTDTTVRREQIESYFNEITLSGEEGLVIKNLNGLYELGEKSRSTALWVKMKPEYGDSTQDLDLLVLGAYYGEGKGLRGRGISTFVCGVKDDKNPNIYHTVCKVGTGYSFDELLRLRQIIDGIKEPFVPGRPPPHLAHWKVSKKDIPNVFIPPEKSIVVQLKCAEIVPSAFFSAGLCCRFPRIQCIRHDKSYTDIMNIKDLYELKQQLRYTTQEVSQRAEASQGSSTQSSRKSKHTTSDPNITTSKRRKINLVDDQFRVSSKSVAQQGQLFENMVFCVLESDFVQTLSNNNSGNSGNGGSGGSSVRKFTREDLIFSIKSQGGTVVASATLPECKIIAGSKRTMQLNNLIERGEQDVIDFSYIIDCVNAGARLPLKRVHLLGMSAGTKKSFRGTVDVFGDSYTEDVTPEELSKILASFDPTMTSLERKIASSGPVVNVSAKAKKAAAGGLKDSSAMEEQKWQQRERQDEVAVLKDHKHMRNMGWRVLAEEHLPLLEEREPLYHSYNSLWQEGVVLYMDVSDDLGSPLPPTHPTTSTNTSTNTSSSNTSSSAGVKSGNSYIHSARSPVRSRPLSSAIGASSNSHAGGVTADPSAVLQATYMRAVRHYAELHGATVSDSLHSKVTHIVMRPEQLSRLSVIRDRMRQLRTLETQSFEKRLVTPQWINFCIEMGHIVEPTLAEHLVSATATL